MLTVLIRAQANKELVNNKGSQAPMQGKPGPSADVLAKKVQAEAYQAHADVQQAFKRAETVANNKVNTAAKNHAMAVKRAQVAQVFAVVMKFLLAWSHST